MKWNFQVAKNVSQILCYLYNVPLFIQSRKPRRAYLKLRLVLAKSKKRSFNLVFHKDFSGLGLRVKFLVVIYLFKYFFFSLVQI